MNRTKTFVQKNSYLNVDLVWDKTGIYPAFVEEDQEVLLNYGAQLVLEFPPNAQFDNLYCLRERVYKVVYDQHEGQEYLLFSINENNEFLLKFTEELVHDLRQADAYFRVVVNPTEVTPIPTSVWEKPLSRNGQIIFFAIYALILLFTVVFTLWFTST
jgi:hypothetical protein